MSERELLNRTIIRQCGRAFDRQAILATGAPTTADTDAAVRELRVSIARVIEHSLVPQVAMLRALLPWPWLRRRTFSYECAFAFRGFNWTLQICISRFRCRLWHESDVDALVAQWLTNPEAIGMFISNAVGVGDELFAA